jgi:hypothetical protein
MLKVIIGGFKKIILFYKEAGAFLEYNDPSCGERNDTLDKNHKLYTNLRNYTIALLVLFCLIFVYVL